MTPTKLIWELNIACNTDRITEEKLYQILVSNLKTDEVNKESFLLDPSNSVTISAFFLREVLKRKLSKKEINLSTKQLSYLINGIMNHGSYVNFQDSKYVLQTAHFLNRLGVQFPVAHKVTKSKNVKIYIK